ncbi:MAG TPA: ABC transporter permease [Solirubrobacteraceae bacterium]|jgi:ribose/xylose/arabinose/galactoside ABC-type transport system permease subunit|nr:ABC transporter permease [Solirubrobacteraceae bacterium]
MSSIAQRDSKAERHRAKAIAKRAARWEAALGVFLAVLIVYFAITTQGFFPSFGGFLSLTQLFVPAGIIALGLTPVMLMGGIDLSVGTTASLAAVVMATAWQDGLSIWLAVVLALAVSALIGAINATLVTRGGIQPFIATLGTSFIYGSIGTAVAGNSPPYGFPDAFTIVGQGAIGGVMPYQLLIFLAVAAVVAIVMARTAGGRRVRMIGFSRGAARYAGVRTWRVTFGAYVACAVLAGLAGVLLGSYYSAVQPDVGNSLLLAAIAMVVLGGVDVFGGAGSLLGVGIAVMIVGLLQQGLLIRGLSDLESSMATGILLIIGVTVRVWYGPWRGAIIGRLSGRVLASDGGPWRAPSGIRRLWKRIRSQQP